MFLIRLPWCTCFFARSRFGVFSFARGYSGHLIWGKSYGKRVNLAEEEIGLHMIYNTWIYILCIYNSCTYNAYVTGSNAKTPWMPMDCASGVTYQYFSSLMWPLIRWARFPLHTANLLPSKWSYSINADRNFCEIQPAPISDHSHACSEAAPRTFKSFAKKRHTINDAFKPLCFAHRAFLIAV